MILENIRAKCEERHISISALEKEMGFGKSTIMNWGMVSPTVGKLQKVAEFFGCTVDELLKQ